MTKDEALKIAIEALEDAQKCLMGHLFLEKLPYVEAINACKEALEQPAEPRLVSYALDGSTCTLNIDGEEVYFNREQPAQEPVSKTAERDYNFMRDLAIGTENILNEMLSAKPVAWTKESELQKTTTLRNPILMWKNQYTSIENNVPLYTHPHQWQGLTDDEVHNMADEAYINVELIQGKGIVFDRLKFYRAIEQALREKNT